MVKIAYKRVSSRDQHVYRQLPDEEFDKIFEEKVSGIKQKRVEVERMIEFCREGDEVHVHSLDRLGRSLISLQKIVTAICDKGASIKFHKENLFFSREKKDPMSQMLFSIFASFAEYQHSLIKEAQREGISLAKERGKYKRKKIFDVTDEVVKKILERISLGASLYQTCKVLGYNYNIVRKHFNEHKIPYKLKETEYEEIN